MECSLFINVISILSLLSVYLVSLKMDIADVFCHEYSTLYQLFHSVSKFFGNAGMSAFETM